LEGLRVTLSRLGTRLGRYGQHLNIVDEKVRNVDFVPGYPLLKSQYITPFARREHTDTPVGSTKSAPHPGTIDID